MYITGKAEYSQKFRERLQPRICILASRSTREMMMTMNEKLQVGRIQKALETKLNSPETGRARSVGRQCLAGTLTLLLLDLRHAIIDHFTRDVSVVRRPGVFTPEQHQHSGILGSPKPTVKRLLVSSTGSRPALFERHRAALRGGCRFGAPCQPPG